jgi:hypothetical protein
MTVNIVRIEDTDEGRTFAPSFDLPMERGAGTFDVDIPPVPWMTHVPWAHESFGVHIRERAPRRDRVVVLGANLPSNPIPHHGADYVLVGNETVEFVEANIPDFVTHADTGDVLTMYCRSLLSSTEQDVPFRLPNIAPRGKPSEPLADYEAYAVENWDGYDALPITTSTLYAARSILRSVPKTFGDPVCSPGADGSIVFEWLNDDGPLRKLFIDIGPGRTWKAYWRLASGKIGSIPRKRITISTIPELQKLFETLLRG